MKIKLVTLAASIMVLVSTNIQANTMADENVSQNEDLDFYEGATDPFLKDTFESIGKGISKGFGAVTSFGGKVIKGIGGLAERAIDVATRVGTKVGPLLVQYGPKLVAMASAFDPKYGGAAQALMQLVPGLSQQQAEGAIAATTSGAGANQTPEAATAAALDLLNSMPVK